MIHKVASAESLFSQRARYVNAKLTRIGFGPRRRHSVSLSPRSRVAPRRETPRHETQKTQPCLASYNLDMQPIFQILGGILLIIFGRRLFWLFVGLLGFFAGFTFASRFFSNQQEWVTLLIAVGCGLIGILLAV